jgi:c-di-GMP-binding flagellar brake protein YcgR
MTMNQYSGPERRRFVRVPFIFPVKFQIAGDPEGRVFHALSDNLSEGGIKIISMQPMEEGADIVLDFALPTPQGVVEIRCSGRIVWYQEAQGRNFCGVQFSEMDGRHQEVLQQFIGKILEFRGQEQV